MLFILIPPVYRFIFERLVGLPPEVPAPHAPLAVALLLPWPGAIGYRRFYQGILIRHGYTRRVAYGTVVRLVTMSIAAAGLAMATGLAGAYIGSLSLCAGVLTEAAASRWMARGIVARRISSFNAIKVFMHKCDFISIPIKTYPVGTIPTDIYHITMNVSQLLFCKGPIKAFYSFFVGADVWHGSDGLAFLKCRCVVQYSVFGVWLVLGDGYRMGVLVCFDIQWITKPTKRPESLRDRQRRAKQSSAMPDTVQKDSGPSGSLLRPLHSSQ